MSETDTMEPTDTGTNQANEYARLSENTEGQQPAAEIPLVSKNPTGEMLDAREVLRGEAARQQREKLDALKADQSESGVAPR